MKAVFLTNSELIFERAGLIRNQGRPNSGTFIHPSLEGILELRICRVGLAQIKRLLKLKLRFERFKIYKSAFEIEDILFEFLKMVILFLQVCFHKRLQRKNRVKVK